VPLARGGSREVFDVLALQRKVVTVLLDKGMQQRRDVWLLSKDAHERLTRACPVGGNPNSAHVGSASSRQQEPGGEDSDEEPTDPDHADDQTDCSEEELELASPYWQHIMHRMRKSTFLG